jgi:hypothetical protein
VDAAVEGEDVELAPGVLAEARDVELRLPRALQVDQLAIDDGLAVPFAQAPDAAGVVIGVDVDAGQLRQGRAAVDVAAGDALAVVLAFGVRRVGVLGQGRDEVGRPDGPLLAAGERVEPLAHAPAVVAAVLDDVDLLPEVLADVAGPERAGPGGRS